MSRSAWTVVIELAGLFVVFLTVAVGLIVAYVATRPGHTGVTHRTR